MKRGKMKRILSILFVATATALAGIAISQAASAPSRLPALGSRFSVLRSAKLAASTAVAPLPAATAKHVTEPGTLVSEYELEPAEAAYVEISVTTHAWVIPGRKGMCLAVPVFKGLSIATTCGSSASAEEGGLVMVRRPSSGPVVYGLAPDDASVTVTNEDGTSTDVPVTHNVFMYADPTAGAVTVHPRGGGEATTPIKPEGQ
jgi:hypothetical protein